MEQKEGKLFSTKEMPVLGRGRKGTQVQNQKNQKRAASLGNKCFYSLIANLYSAL